MCWKSKQLTLGAVIPSFNTILNKVKMGDFVPIENRKIYEKGEVVDAPNIFDYATKELSQDAFLCWLVEWARQQDDGVLKVCGLNLISEFFALATNRTISGSEISEISTPALQLGKVDVSFQASVCGKRYQFIIEDKIDTVPHSNQLKKYKNHFIKERGFKEEDLICVYFKLNELTSDRLTAQKENYGIFDIYKIAGFLNNYECDNEIFNSYKRHVLRKKDELSELRKEFHEKQNFELLRHRHIQWHYIESLHEACPEGHEELCVSSQIYNGTNRGGTPWTQYWFVHRAGIYPEATENKDEKIFFRIDHRKHNGKLRYYLRINQYADIKQEASKQLKTRRLKKYREIWDDALATTRAKEELSWAPARNDFSGSKESEISILFFDKEINTPKRVLEIIPEVHSRFVKSIDNAVTLGEL